MPTKDPIQGNIELEDNEGPPTAVGEIVLDGTTIKAQDDAGVFNVRQMVEHPTIRDLIHFLDEGPGDGFASGAYKEVTGSPFPTLVVWWTSAAKTAKLVDKQIAYTGAFATTITWRIYDTDGSTVLHTVTDAITYSGASEATRTRTIS